MDSLEEILPARAAPPKNENALYTLRSYQAEMVEESLKSNIIVAMDTGSGKTQMYVFCSRKTPLDLILVVHFPVQLQNSSHATRAK